MPRTRQYQAPKAPNDQAYGQRGDQIAAQQAMPLPQNAAPPPRPSTSGPTGPSVIDAAAGFDPGITPLTAPSTRPGEPVTAGLSTGPGPGREIFDTPQRALNAAAVLESMGMASGDAELIELAFRIRQRGGMI